MIGAGGEAQVQNFQERLVVFEEAKKYCAMAVNFDPNDPMANMNVGAMIKGLSQVLLTGLCL